jgi:hypothetical protein
MVIVVIGHVVICHYNLCHYGRISILTPHSATVALFAAISLRHVLLLVGCKFRGIDTPGLLSRLSD